jgi:hypothetical protein
MARRGQAGDNGQERPGRRLEPGNEEEIMNNELGGLTELH